MPTFIRWMGLFYTKDSEGSLYYNFTEDIAPGDAVAPGNCYVYKWLVADGSAPDPGYESKLWSYHNYISQYQDFDSGLIGPAIVYNRGMMNRVMSQNRELIILYAGYQEFNSILALENIAKINETFYNEIIAYNDPIIWPGMNYSYWNPQARQYTFNNVLETTTELPNVYAVNGFIYANNPPFEMCLYDDVIWYFYSFGKDDVSINPPKSSLSKRRLISFSFFFFL